MNKRRIEEDNGDESETIDSNTKKLKTKEDKDLSSLTKWTLLNNEGMKIGINFAPAFNEKDKMEFKSSESLLETPISKLIESLEEKERMKMHNEQLKKNRSNITIINDKKLWVEKYKPTSYTELLSDEKTNRELLTWLKQWDAYVFKKEVPKKSNNFKDKNGFQKKEDPNDSRPFNKIALLSGPPGLGKTTISHLIGQMAGYSTFEINASEDRSIKTLPDKVKSIINTGSVTNDKPKCLIIDEIDGIVNSEAKNSIEFLVKLCYKKKDEKKDKNKDTDVIQRPIICICNDLYSPALKNLRKVAKIFRFQSFDSTLLVSRLENICKQENLDVEKQALMDLCKWNGNDIRACLNTLQFANTAFQMQLNDPTFLNDDSMMQDEDSVKKTEKLRVNTQMLKKISMGYKDMHSSLFVIWENIFTENSYKFDPNSSKKKVVLMEYEKDSLQKKRKEYDFSNIIKETPQISLDPYDFYGYEPSQNSSNFERKHNFDFIKLANTINHHSDRDLIVEGCFENYLSIKTFLNERIVLDKASKTLEWFEFFDSMNNKVNGEDLGHYISSVVGSVHLNMASHMKPKNLKFPSQFFKVRSETIASKSLLRSFMSGMNPNVISSLGFSFASVNLELLTHLLNIISPSPNQLVSVSENQQSILENLANIYFDFGLSFEQRRESNNSNENNSKKKNYPPKRIEPESDNYYLSPSIQSLVSFPSLENSGENSKNSSDLSRFGVSLSYTIKQQLNLLIRKLSFNSNENNKPKVVQKKEVKSTPKTPVKSFTPSQNSLTPSHSVLPSPSQGSLPSPQKKDFFGRPIVEKVKKDDSVSTKVVPCVRFKYAEGFANAVKRPVKISYFL